MARDASCVLGPEVVPRARVPDPDALSLRTFVDGRLVQSASTSENVATSTAVYGAHATDADGTAANNTVIYSMAAGVGDDDLFSIDGAGNVRFKVSPDYEAPADVNHDNQYDITVLASDGLASHQTSLHVAIMVSDVLLA